MKTATKEYIRPMPATWWLNNRQLVMFMVRELTAVFVGAYAIFLLVLLALDGNQFANVLRSPVSLVFQLICLLFVLYHTYTWFELTPKAIVLWRGDEKVNPALIVGANYAVWVLVSVAQAALPAHLRSGDVKPVDGSCGPLTTLPASAGTTNRRSTPISDVSALTAQQFKKSASVREIASLTCLVFTARCFCENANHDNQQSRADCSRIFLAASETPA